MYVFERITGFSCSREAAYCIVYYDKLDNCSDFKCNESYREFWL